MIRIKIKLTIRHFRSELKAMESRGLISGSLANAIISVIELLNSNREHAITDLPEMTDSIKRDIRLYFNNRKLSLDGKVFQLGELKPDPSPFDELKLKTVKLKKRKAYLSMAPVYNPGYGFHCLRP
jgi:hypothetical protein